MWMITPNMPWICVIERIEEYSWPARTYTTDFTVVERASTKLAR